VYIDIPHDIMLYTGSCHDIMIYTGSCHDIMLYTESCIAVHLLSTLSQHIGRYEGQSTEALDILSQLTGLDLEPVPSTSVVLHQGVIPSST